MIDASTSTTNFRTTLLHALLWFGVVLLPFDFLPLRFEGHETHRAGLTLVIAVGMLGALLLNPEPLRPRYKLETVFLAVLGCFAVSLILSTVFALSPTLALIGDLIRRMGLLTQLGLVVLVFAAREIHWRWLAHGFWIAGVICAVFTLLQLVGWISNPIDGRAFGPLGAPTFTAIWLVNALIWSSVWTLSERPRSRWLSLVRAVGLMLMVGALLATGGRGALIALAAGGVVGGLAFVWVTRRRLLLYVIGGLLALTVIGLFGLSQLDWEASPLATWPLISRLNPTLPDTPRAVREQVWQNVLAILDAPPQLTPFDGPPDRFYTLRPWFGYGQDHFELVHRPYIDDVLRAMDEGRPIDRAHNVILDLLMMQGAVGLLIWLAVWGSAVVLALRQLTLARQSQRSYWRPLLVLMIIAAHSVDLLFSFETLAGGWGAWLALGLLLHRATGAEPSELFSASFNSERWLIVTSFAMALLLGRGLSPLSSDETVPIVALLILVAAISAAILLTLNETQTSLWRCIRTHVVSSLTGMVLGLLLGRIQSADGAALMAGVVFAGVIGALVLVTSQRLSVRQFRPITALIAVLMLFAAFYWFSETRAQIEFSQGIAPGMLAASAETQVEHHRQAALDFPLDAKLQRYGAIALYQAAVNRIEGVDIVMLADAQKFGESAVWLNAYDADALLTLADIEYAFASVSASPDDALHIQRAMLLEEAASALLRPAIP